MQASFRIITPDGETLGEDEVAARFDELRPQLSTFDSLEGILALYNDGGSFRRTAFRDELGALVYELCFAAVPDLAAGKAVEVSLFAFPEKAQFTPEGDAVEVTGDAIRPDHCPARPLLEALVGCGDRYLALLKRMHAGDAEYAEGLTDWDAAAARARASLA